MATDFASGDSIQTNQSTKMDATLFGSLAFWIKTTQTGLKGVLARASNTSNSGITVVMDSVIALGVKDASAYVASPTSVGTVNDGNWRHLGFSWGLTSGDPCRVYIDGALDGAANATGDWNFGGAGAHVLAGRVIDTFWGAFVGSIAELGWWNEALTAAEFAALAEGFRPPRIRTPALCIYEPLVRTLYDAVGNATTASGTSVSDHPRVI